MPLLGARSAPAKFSGKYDTVKKFICQYKQIFAVYNIPDKEKCRQIIDYCSTKVTRFVEAIDSFVKEDWVQLEKDILTYYNAELNESRYLTNGAVKEFMTSKDSRNISESDDESDEDEPREKSKKQRRNQDNHWQEKLEEKGKSKAKNKKEPEPERNQMDEVEELVGLLLSPKNRHNHSGYHGSTNSTNWSHIPTHAKIKFSTAASVSRDGEDNHGRNDML
ncbi:hypothetical protein ARMGADRAFT_1030124 [Armillaria gallica]|uniref:Uncharacterized protein n=1 Tax=Armillaria gallica TaxID=47427 RepID=A0A2H3DE60_ARMGA|nr:hypothetical protein ARMGADRAFT_1030124 [Armillaria gallica]